jgi:PQ loop repeat
LARLAAGLQASTITIISLGGRVPQILLNVRRGNSGELSLLTCLLNVLGNAARIFTTIVLVKDGLLLTGAMVQGCLNSVLLWQTVDTWQNRGKLKPDHPPSPVQAAVAS